MMMTQDDVTLPIVPIMHEAEMAHKNERFMLRFQVLFACGDRISDSCDSIPPCYGPCYGPWLQVASHDWQDTSHSLRTHQWANVRCGARGRLYAYR